jgi:Cu+-exporting ATPase
MDEKHVDPVCGMEVTEKEAACSYDFKGKTYYFCNESCRDEFQVDPARFLDDGDRRMP